MIAAEENKIETLNLMPKPNFLKSSYNFEQDNILDSSVEN